MSKKAAREPTQKAKFIEAAKALDCDDDKERFEKRLGKIAKAKPTENSKKSK